MESKIINNKKVNDGILELFEFTDSSGKIINYLAVKAYTGKNISSGHGGAAKLEEINFNNKQEAINFFNNQN